MRRGRGRLWAAILGGIVLLSLAGPGAETTGVEDLLLVRTVAVDGTRITADTGALQDGKPPVTVSGEGESVSAAVQAMGYNETGSAPFFSHTEHIVLGSATVDGQLHPVLDWMLRSMEIRLDTRLWCVTDGEAGALLELCTAREAGLSDALQLLSDDAPSAGLGRTYTLGEVLRSLLEDGYALIPALELSQPPKPAGFAVVDENGLVGCLPADGAQGVAMLTGSWEPHPLYLGESGVTLLVTAGHTKMPSQGRAEIALTAKCAVVQMDRALNLADEAVYSAITAEAQEAIRREAEAAQNGLAALGLEHWAGTVTVSVELTRTYDRSPSGGM